MTKHLELLGAPAWPADWSQFLPDLVSSAIVGVAIGIVFYLWQKRSEEHQAERLALAAWSTVRSRIIVGLTLEVPERPWLDHRLENPFSDLAAATDGLPLAQWSDAASSNRELQLLKSIATELPLLAHAGQELFRSVDVALMTIDPSSVFSTDRDYLRSATMRALSEDGDSVGFAGSFMAAFGAGSQEKYDHLDDIARQAAQSKRSLSKFADYFGLYTEIRRQYVLLRGIVRPAAPVQQVSMH
jgi:hypothetical protein